MLHKILVIDDSINSLDPVIITCQELKDVEVSVSTWKDVDLKTLYLFSLIVVGYTYPDELKKPVTNGLITEQILEYSMDFIGKIALISIYTKEKLKTSFDVLTLSDKEGYFVLRNYVSKQLNIPIEHKSTTTIKGVVFEVIHNGKLVEVSIVVGNCYVDHTDPAALIHSCGCIKLNKQEHEMSFLDKDGNLFLIITEWKRVFYKTK